MGITHNESARPQDLRIAGSPNDPGFQNPIVVGSIEQRRIQRYRPDYNRERVAMVDVEPSGDSGTQLADVRAREEEPQLEHATETTDATTEVGRTKGINREAVVRLFSEEGLSKADVARRLGCSANTVNYHLNKAQENGELPDENDQPAVTQTKAAPPESNPGPVANAYVDLGREIGQLVADKQQAYGDSFGHAGQVLRILWPNGVKPEHYDDVLTVTRIVDKLFRVASDKDAFGEDPYRDICGYALLAVAKHGQRE